MERNMERLGDILTLHLPKTLAFGKGSAVRLADDLAAGPRRRVFVITSRLVLPLAEPWSQSLRQRGLEVSVWEGVNREPTVTDFQAALKAAQAMNADAVVGFGGGSALDVAKLVAAMLDNPQDIHEVFGIGKLAGRSTFLVCLPTTAGTGSEVSPNAILLDESEHVKKGVISPHLVPDVTCVDPLLTRTLPPAVTASTGLDALTHCIEAYANRFAHPVIDHYALEGIRLIAGSLRRAFDCGDDLDARARMALGSLYGGLCLGQVNTGAVHALAYPLGSEFHVAHGVANAVMLPHVLEFNLSAAPESYAQVALALGAVPSGSTLETARCALSLVCELSRHCQIPRSLSELGVPESAVPRLAKGAMKITRLLERNVRHVTEEDAVAIYRKAFL